MKKALSALLGLYMLLLFAAGCSDVSVVEDYQHEPSGTAKYTIMVYLLGSDLETKHGMASTDLEEMIRADFNRKDINVMVQTGGSTMWWAFGIPDNNPARFLVVDGGVALLEELPAQSMVEPQTLTDFIDYGMTEFPAERYGLVMWDHGSGAVWGYGGDEYYPDDEMVLGELGQALGASMAAQEKLEFIGFDACLMANLETAWVARKYARYLIASEELEPGYGWDFDNWLSILGDDPTMTGDEIGRVIVDSFIAFYNENDMGDEATTLSLIDLSRLEPVVSALEDFIGVANMNQYEYQQIAKPRAGTKEFGLPHEYGSSCDMIDIIHMCQQFSEVCPDEAEALISAVEDAVLYKSQGSYVENAGGLSLYFPYSQRDVTPRRVEVYKTSGFSPAYIDYVVVFANVLCGTTLAPMDVSAYMPQEVAEGEYEIRLTDEQLNNLSHVYFTVWMHYDGDDYMQIHQSSGAEIAEDGTILTSYDGSFATINDEVVCLYEIEVGENYTRYGIPAELNGEDVNLIVLMDEANPEGKVLGAMPVTTENGMAPKQMIAIKDGDEIGFCYYTEGFQDVGDDSVDEDYEGPYWLITETFKVSGPLELQHWEALEGEFLYGFTIFDLQGNEYNTDFIVVEFYE